MSLVLVPIRVAGRPDGVGTAKSGATYRIPGKPEDWRLSVNGMVLQHPHPSFADSRSAELYGQLLKEELA